MTDKEALMKKSISLEEWLGERKFNHPSELIPILTALLEDRERLRWALRKYAQGESRGAGGANDYQGFATTALIQSDEAIRKIVGEK